MSRAARASIAFCASVEIACWQHNEWVANSNRTRTTASDARRGDILLTTWGDLADHVQKPQPIVHAGACDPSNRLCTQPYTLFKGTLCHLKCRRYGHRRWRARSDSTSLQMLICQCGFMRWRFRYAFDTKPDLRRSIDPQGLQDMFPGVIFETDCTSSRQETQH